MVGLALDETVLVVEVSPHNIHQLHPLHPRGVTFSPDCRHTLRTAMPTTDSTPQRCYGTTLISLSVRSGASRRKGRDGVEWKQ